MIKRRISLQNVGRTFHQIMQEFTLVRVIGRGSNVVVYRPATHMGEAGVQTGGF